MQSTANDVTVYLDQVPDERRACLAALRTLCLDTLAGYHENMSFGMPSYQRNGTVEVAFASQKNYISLYMLKSAVVAAHREELAGLKVGKGCIRYTKPEKLDFALIEKLLVATRESPQAR